MFILKLGDFYTFLKQRICVPVGIWGERVCLLKGDLICLLGSGFFCFEGGLSFERGLISEGGLPFHGIVGMQIPL